MEAVRQRILASFRFSVTSMQLNLTEVSEETMSNARQAYIFQPHRPALKRKQGPARPLTFG